MPERTQLETATPSDVEKPATVVAPHQPKQSRRVGLPEYHHASESLTPGQPSPLQQRPPPGAERDQQSPQRPPGAHQYGQPPQPAQPIHSQGTAMHPTGHGQYYPQHQPQPEYAYPPPQNQQRPPTVVFNYAVQPQRAPQGGYGQAQPKRASQRPQSRQDDDTVNAFARSFSNKAIRQAFIRKVYLILFTQLLFTVGVICLFLFVDPLKRWAMGPGWWCTILAIVLFIALYITLVCCRNIRRASPLNYICLGLFTLSLAYVTGAISSSFNTSSVLIAAAITCALCLGITLFAIQTKIDFTMCSGLLFVMILVLFLFGIAVMIVNMISGPNRIMSCVYGALGAFVFGMFLVFDTQQIIGGRQYEISPEEYVYGALQLYLDIVYIFIFILTGFGK